jgi:uncharacterized iron-regulated membrane protein
MTTPPATVPSEMLPPASGALYRAVWRWHFYAGLITAPLAIFLAITGAIYLWKPQYEAARYRDLLSVEPLYTAVFAGVTPTPLCVAADTQFATALKAHPGAAVVSFTPSFAAGQTSETILRLPDGDVVSVFVNPHLGRIVGERRESERFMTTIHHLHGELLAGKAGSYVTELGASWLFVLLLTGLYLWWPRPKFSVWGFLLPRLRAKGRVFWRDLHAVPAVWASVGALFFLTTGIPWTTVSGAWFKRISAALGEGTPRESQASAHRSELTGWSPPLRPGLAAEIEKLASEPPAAATAPPVPMVMVHEPDGTMLTVPRDHPRAIAEYGPPAPANEPAPRRGPPDAASLEWCGEVLGPNMKRPPISLEHVIRLAAQHNVPTPYAIAPPTHETAVFSVLSDRHQARSRTYLHLDQYSGVVLADVRYKDFGLWGKFVLWGIVAHEGRLFGLLNQILGTLGALGVLYMAASAIALWWHRRPEGGFAAAPARVGPAGLPRVVRAGALVLCVALPLLAASFAVCWGVDRALARRAV